MNNDILYLVIPCYNEAAVLPETSKRLQAKLSGLISDHQVSAQSKILFVDDGSQDTTWSIIEDLHQHDPLFTGVKLSRNRGHQNALLAGLTTAYQHADVTISLDADLQDDINAIDKMLAAYQDGCQIVYGVHAKRKKDHFLKRFTAESFYKLMQKFGVDIVFNHADYRLMSKTALTALLQYPESNLFLRGIVPQIGYKTAVVEYERERRQAGKSKYSLRKMFALAGDGITSFSCQPLYTIFWLGIIFTLLGFLALAATLTCHCLGLISMLYPLIATLVLLSGIIICCLGIVGIYVGKTYFESKHRPRFFIEKEL